MFKRQIITFFAIAGITASALALAYTDNPNVTSLEENEEYQQLMAESERLTAMEDSIRTILSDMRTMMRSYRDSLDNAPMDMEAYANRVVQLEEELFNITSEQGEVANRINAIEMAIIEQQFAMSIFEKMENSSHVDDELDEVKVDNDSIPSVISTEECSRRNIIDNDCFTKSLMAEDLNELRALQLDESNIESLSNEYIAKYELLRTIDSDYATATTQHMADSLYNHLEPTMASLDSLNTLISHKWNHIIDTKYYAYGYIAEKRRNTDLLNKLDTEFTAMLQQCAANDDLYTSNGLMRYSIGRPTILDFEIDMAEELGLNEAKDSLIDVRNSLVVPTYQYPTMELPERRLFIDYEDISFGRTNYYNNTNPVPDVKIYERGMIYRILLGSFKARQPMTLFKGVQPLYIYKDEEGLNHYFAGGYATYEEAENAQRQLFNKGFKAPEICCWLDGVMTNLTEDEELTKEDEQEAPATLRYMLRIEESAMNDDIKLYIENQTPGKMISLTNEGYIVGAFDNHDEATRLYLALSDEFGIDLEIIEIELH